MTRDPFNVQENLCPIHHRQSKQVYKQFSVPEYWIVDPENQTIKRYRLGENGTFADPEVFTVSITFDSIPGGAVMDLKRVW